MCDDKEAIELLKKTFTGKQASLDWRVPATLKDRPDAGKDVPKV